MAEIRKFPIFMVERDNEAAMRVVRKLADGRLEPGAIIPLDADEWAALQASVVQMDLDHER